MVDSTLRTFVIELPEHILRDVHEDAVQMERTGKTPEDSTLRTLTERFLVSQGKSYDPGLILWMDRLAAEAYRRLALGSPVLCSEDADEDTDEDDLVGKMRYLDSTRGVPLAGVQAVYEGEPAVEVHGFGRPIHLAAEHALRLGTLLQGAAYEARTLRAARKLANGEEAQQIAKLKAELKAKAKAAQEQAKGGAGGVHNHVQAGPQSEEACEVMRDAIVRMLKGTE
jgi:hypothetical protein